MEINELPFFVLLIITILPITIGIILSVRLMNFFIDMYKRYKEKESFASITEIGDLLLMLIFISVMIELMLYITGSQPDTFSLFTFLIEDMLPTTWYTMLLYGALVNITLLVKKDGVII